MKWMAARLSFHCRRNTGDGQTDASLHCWIPGFPVANGLKGIYGIIQNRPAAWSWSLLAFIILHHISVGVHRECGQLEKDKER